MDPRELRGCPLFETLSSDQLRAVAALATRREVAGGQPLFKEGDAGAEMYVVVSGRVRISKRVPGVGEEALSILEPGSYFGEMAMIDDAPRSADAIAHTPCTLAVIRRDDLDQLMFVDKDLAYDLLWTFVRTLASRLRETNEKIRAFFAMSGPGAA
jgi:CRP-like cAMP-binding protein